MTDFTFGRYWKQLRRRYKFMIVRTPDERDEYIASQKATIERIIIRSANTLRDRLDGIVDPRLVTDDTEHEVPC